MQQLIKSNHPAKWPILVIALISAVIGIKVLFFSQAAPGDCNKTLAAGGNVQTFVNGLVAGDVGCISNGEYTLGATIAVNNSGSAGNLITIRAQSKWGVVLKGNNTVARAFKLNGDYIKIQDFEIKEFANASESTAIEIYNGGGDNSVISGNHIHHIANVCSTSSNGLTGIFAGGTGLTIEGNYIHDIGRTPSCSSDRSHDHGIYMNETKNSVVRNNVFSNNQSGFAIQLYPFPVSNISIENNTFYKCNDSKSYACMIVGSESGDSPATGTNISIKNNIFNSPAASSTSRVIEWYRNANTTYSNVVLEKNVTNGGSYGTLPASGVTLTGNQTSKSPAFVNAAGGDFHLLGTDNVAKDQGVTTSNVTNDYDGTPRPQGPAYDIGAFEFQTSSTPPPPPPTSGTGCTKTAVPGDSLQTFFDGLQPGDVACIRGGTYTQEPIIRKGGTSSSWVTIKNYPNEQVVIQPPQGLTSGDHYAIRVYNTAAYVKIQGLILQDAYAVGCSAGNIYIVNETDPGNPTHDIDIVGNEIKNSRGGSGVYLDPYTTKIRVIGNKIHGNKDDKNCSGGQAHGIYMQGTYQLAANNIIYNHNDPDGGYGIQMYPRGDNNISMYNTIYNNALAGIVLGEEGAGNTNAKIVNNMIINNGGAISRVGTPTSCIVQNNIFYGNASNTVSPSCSTSNNSTANPNLVSSTDFHLTANSLTAINKAVGTPDLPTGYLNDFDGNARPGGAQNDIGAYEYNSGGATPLPTASITAPAQGATVTGIAPVTATASGTGVLGVQFKLDGQNLQAEDTTAPYTINWDSKTTSNGAHNLTAVARNSAGAGSPSSPISVTVNNVVADTTPPNTNITSTPIGSTTNTNANFNFSSTESGSTFQCSLDNAAYASCTSPKSYTGLAIGSHNFRVYAVDAAGNKDDLTPATETWTITQPDTTAPQVSVTAPANGATVSSASLAITANATDVAMSRVDFRITNSAGATILTASDNSPAYATTWNTLAVANGSYTIRATAYDTSGNNAFNEVTVNVNNPDTQKPSAPTNLNGSAASQTQINLTWTASTDNVGVTGYTILRGGVAIGTATTTSYQDNSVVAGQTYSYTVVARDAAGNPSDPSAAKSISTPAPADTTPPAPAPVVTATPFNSTQINLSWTPSSDTGGSGLRGYNVYRNGSTTAINGNTPITGTSLGDTGLSPATTYSYTVKAVDGAGNSVASNPVSATTQAQSTQTTITFNPTADAYVLDQRRRRNNTYGTASTLETVGYADAEKSALLKFTVSGIATNQRVASAKLRLHVSDYSNRGGYFHRITDNNWTEGVTFNTLPIYDPSTIATLGTVYTGSWVEVDVSSLITGNGTYGIFIDNDAQDTARFSSRETSNKPQLILSVQ